MTGSPAREAFAESGLADARLVLESALRDGAIPGAVAAVGVGHRELARWVTGDAERWCGRSRAMTDATVFDLASLTKVTATLPAVLLLVQDGRCSLDDPLTGLLPDLPLTDDRLTPRHLLTHTGGLPAHRPFHERVSGLRALVRAAAAEPLERPPGSGVTYSDLGFLLLGAMVAAVAEEPLPAFAARRVFGPLGMSATFEPPAAWLARTAATEVVDGRPVLGVVHDENAAAGGPGCGHAGLFGTLDDLVRYVRAWVDPGESLVGPPLRAEAVRCATEGMGGARGLGWTCRGDAYDILADGWGPDAVSHTGFTGTSLAFDPRSGRWAVLLTNAVHFGRNRDTIVSLRRRFHAALVGDA